MPISITSAMQMSNTDEQLDQPANELWTVPMGYFQPHISAIQYSRTGSLVDIDKQTPVSPERFNGKGERTAVRGLPKK